MSASNKSDKHCGDTCFRIVHPLGSSSFLFKPSTMQKLRAAYLRWLKSVTSWLSSIKVPSSCKAAAAKKVVKNVVPASESLSESSSGSLASGGPSQSLVITGWMSFHIALPSVNLAMRFSASLLPLGLMGSLKMKSSSLSKAARTYAATARDTSLA